METDPRPNHRLGQPSLAVAAAGPGWLVVEKPCGMSVHNDPGGSVCATMQAMLTRAPGLAGRTAFVSGNDVRAAHRLDRDTSGLVLLCCAPSTLTFYGRAFQERQIGKCYLAVVHGRLAAPGGCGEWTHPLSRSAGGRRNAAGAGRRAPCRTLFTVLGHSDRYSLAACFPVTGRRHQIRRHAKLAGHPVVGDRRYGSPRALRYLREQAGLMRLGLHAHGLDLPQAEGALRLRVFSRGMPATLLALLAADGRQPPAVWAEAVAALARTADWPSSGPSARRGFN